VQKFVSNYLIIIYLPPCSDMPLPG